MWDLSFHMGIPSMFAYGPEVYELHPWGGVGDCRFNLDTDTHTVNFLTQRLADLHNRSSPKETCPSGGASPASSTAP